MIQLLEILTALKDQCVLVGSASRGDSFRDIDLVISQRGLKIALKVFPKGWTSAFIGNLKTFDTPIPIEVFTYWYGPDYAELVRKRKKELGTKVLLGVELRTWSTSTWEGKENGKAE